MYYYRRGIAWSKASWNALSSKSVVPGMIVTLQVFLCLVGCHITHTDLCIQLIFRVPDLRLKNVALLDALQQRHPNSIATLILAAKQQVVAPDIKVVGADRASASATVSAGSVASRVQAQTELRVKQLTDEVTRNLTGFVLFSLKYNQLLPMHFIFTTQLQRAETTHTSALRTLRQTYDRLKLQYDTTATRLQTELDVKKCA